MPLAKHDYANALNRIGNFVSSIDLFEKRFTIQALVSVIKAHQFSQNWRKS